MVCKKYGLDLKTAYKGIKISSGNSFVHETESQVILNGSYDVGFTMDLVCKDVGLFDKLTKKYEIPAELSSLMLEIFQRGRKNLGDRALSTSIVKLLEEKCNENLRASGFPSYLEDKKKDNEDNKDKKKKKDAEIILICGVGGQAALTGKTLIEMGYKNVLNVGGIPDWEKNGGPMKKY